MTDGGDPEDASLDDPRWRERADGDDHDKGSTRYTRDSRRVDADGSPGDGTSDSDPDPVELGVALLSRLEHAELSVADALDRIEAITTVPDLQRSILETAEARGVVERNGDTLRPTGGSGPGATHVRFERDVIVRHGEFTCQRCGADVGEGHFVRLDPGEVGPYGSSCVRTVVGRD